MWPCFVVSSKSSLVSLVAAATFLTFVSRGLADYQPDYNLISQHSYDFYQLHWIFSYDTEKCGTVTPEINIKTRNFTLWPVRSQSPPVSIGADYNVTKFDPSTLDGAAELNVTLLLLLNENVLAHVPYVVCNIEIRNVYGDTVCERKSDTVSLPPAVTTPTQTTTVMSSATSTDTTTINSASRTHCNNYLSPLLCFCILLCMYMLL